jgi:hypothetical protein
MHHTPFAMSLSNRPKYPSTDSGRTGGGVIILSAHQNFHFGFDTALPLNRRWKFQHALSIRSNSNDSTFILRWLPVAGQFTAGVPKLLDFFRRVVRVFEAVCWPSLAVEPEFSAIRLLQMRIHRQPDNGVSTLFRGSQQRARECSKKRK